MIDLMDQIFKLQFIIGKNFLMMVEMIVGNIVEMVGELEWRNLG
jgi:hypothetical protein